MGKFTYRDGVATAQLVAFAPALLLGVLLCLRHGFAKSSGWVFLITLAVLRLVGATCQLITISDASKGVEVTSGICTGIGLSPLTLLCMGFLARVNSHVPRPVNNMIPKLVGLVSLLGVCLGIYGGVKAGNSGDAEHIETVTKVAVIIFSAVYVVTVLFFFLMLSQATHVMQGEKRLLMACCVSLPLIGVRVVYALIADFGNNLDFNYFSGSVTLYLCMAVIEEIVVIYLCIAIGLTVKVLPRDQGYTKSDRSSEERMVETSTYPGNGYVNGPPQPARDQYMHTAVPAPSQPRQAPPKRKGRGPITALYAAGMNAYDSHKANQQH